MLCECLHLQQGKCAYSIAIVAIYWMTECLPLAVTAIMPVVLMTWFGVMDSRRICKNYLKVRVGCILPMNPNFCIIVMGAHSNGQAIIFYPCGFYLLILYSFFHRLISTAADLMSTILPHMMWP